MAGPSGGKETGMGAARPQNDQESACGACAHSRPIGEMLDSDAQRLLCTRTSSTVLRTPGSSEINRIETVLHAIPITERISQPTPEQVRTARDRARLTQAQAAQLISPAQIKPYRSWQCYEVSEGQKGGRAIPLAVWELFLLLTEQHPSLKLKSAPSTGKSEVLLQ